MIFHNDSIGIDFDLKHNQEVDIGGPEPILIVHSWVDDSAGDVNHTRTNGNTNRLEVAPQIGTVAIENKKYPYKVGDRVFMHYMAYDTSLDDEPWDLDGKKISIVHAPYIFFKINVDGSFEMADNTFLGKRVMEKEVRLESGIFINVLDKPRACRIKITHVPQNNQPCGVDNIREYPVTRGENSHYPKVGEVVITVDDHQYPVDYLGEEFIKLTSEEIVGEIIEM